MEAEILEAESAARDIWRAWWMEPFIATSSFAIFLNIFWYLERRQGLSQEKTFQIVNLFRWSDWGDTTISGVAYWFGILLIRLFVPTPKNIPDGLPTDLLSTSHLVLEVISGIVLYDAIFFLIHMSMHRVPWLRWIHRDHHQLTPVESLDTLRHSFLDGSLQVLVNILIQQYTPWGMRKSRTARALHNVIVVWMLVESHTRVPQGYVWRRLCIGVREHWRHHDPNAEHDSMHFQQFFGYLDFWLKRR